MLTYTTQKVFALRWRRCPNGCEIATTEPHVGVGAALGVAMEVEERLVPQLEVGAIALATRDILQPIDCAKRFDQL